MNITAFNNTDLERACSVTEVYNSVSVNEAILNFANNLTLDQLPR